MKNTSSDKNGYQKRLGLFVTILTIAGYLVHISMAAATLKSKVDEQGMQIEKVEKNLEELPRIRERLSAIEMGQKLILDAIKEHLSRGK